MAITHSTTLGTLVKPGAYATYRVLSEPAGLASTGVLMLVGEATTGPHYTTDTLKDNWFGPDQVATVRAKYGSGPIVDAFVNAIRPSTDPEIPGAPTRIYIAKTNKGTKGSLALGTYGTLQTKLEGATPVTVTISDLDPGTPATTGPLTLASSRTGSSDLVFRIDGGDAITVAIASADTASAVKTKIENAVPDLAVAVDGASFVIGATAPGKTVEITDGDEILLSDGVSLAEAPVILTGTSERRIRLVAETDTHTDTVEAGGQITFQVAYRGTAKATVVVGASKVTGFVGATPIWEADYAIFGNLKQLADYINSFPNWNAKPFSAVHAGKPTAALDGGTYGVTTETATGYPARIKMDAAFLYAGLYNTASLVELTGEAASGLPDTVGPVLIIGTKGPTLQSDITGALDALKGIQGNFPVTLFSRNSDSLKAEGLTDTDSNFSIDGINNYLRAHNLECSQIKARKNRQGFASFRGSFADSKLAANDLNVYRIALAFEDILTLGSDGFLHWYDPWMGAVVAAAAQAAAGHKAIFNKSLAINGIRHTEYDSGEASQIEDALLNGLLCLEKREDGTIAFVSDQTTYTTDDNFVYNSIQATYAADTIAGTIRSKMHKAFVGASLADISASVALSYLQSICSELIRLKLIASSSDAPLGYRNATIRIEGPVMYVAIEVKLAGAVYFIPINISISAVSQSASA